MNKETLEKILGRPEYQELVNFKSDLKGKRILITGAKGSIGERLRLRLLQGDAYVMPTDISDMDVTNHEQVKYTINHFKPDVIIHLAGAKHAPQGEHETWRTLEINAIGTKNIIDNKGNARVILTSTCKSCNPETVYGATKLIAERMVLNSGGSIARFFNVVETQGNVFEIWKDKKDIDVAVNCKRHFISINEAVGLILSVISFNESGRYIINSPDLRSMYSIAENIYPDRAKRWIGPRRGDRLIEKFMSTNEKIDGYELNTRVVKISSNNDK